MAREDGVCHKVPTDGLFLTPCVCCSCSRGGLSFAFRDAKGNRLANARTGQALFVGLDIISRGGLDFIKLLSAPPLPPPPPTAEAEEEAEEGEEGGGNEAENKAAATAELAPNHVEAPPEPKTVEKPSASAGGSASAAAAGAQEVAPAGSEGKPRASGFNLFGWLS